MSTDLADLVARVVALESEIEKHWHARVADLERQLLASRARRMEERRRARPYKRAVRCVMAMRLRTGRDYFSPMVNAELDRVESYLIGQQRSAKARAAAEVTPEALRPLSEEELKSVVPVSDEAVLAALAKGQRDVDATLRPDRALEPTDEEMRILLEDE